LSYWLKELRDNAEKTIVIALVGNKVDVLFTDPSKREVQKEEAVQFARQNDLIFTEESSALADVNVKEVIDLLAQRTSPSSSR
jgi:GTPase SAR1 family protein